MDSQGVHVPEEETISAQNDTKHPIILLKTELGFCGSFSVKAYILHFGRIHVSSATKVVDIKVVSQLSNIPIRPFYIQFSITLDYRQFRSTKWMDDKTGHNGNKRQEVTYTEV